jgi:hypothetical protein
MLKRLTLQNVGPAPAMELQFGDRLNLLTGDNGLGKSFLLDIAWWALTGNWPAEVNKKLSSGGMAKPNSIDRSSIDFSFLSWQVFGKDRYYSLDKCRYDFERKHQNWVGIGRVKAPFSGLVVYAQADGSIAIWDPARNYRPVKDYRDPNEHRPPAYVFSHE